MLLTLLSISIILSVFLITQVYKNFDLEKRVKHLEGEFEPPKIVILEKIPDKITLSNVDPDHNIIKDVIESIDLENWSCNVEEEFRFSSYAYNLTFKNPSNSVEVISRFYLDPKEIKERKFFSKKITKAFASSIGLFIIRSNDAYISYDKEESKGTPIESELCLFLWRKVLQYHINTNDELRLGYESSIKNIKSKLLTLNRDRKLQNII